MAYLPTLGATGQNMYDASGMGRDGTLNTFATTAWVETSPYGSWCLDYDGASDYISFPGTYALNGQITIAAWINTDTIGAGQRFVFSSGTSSASNDIQLSVNATAGKVRLNWDNAVILDSTASISVGTWVHVVAVRGGVTGAWTSTIYFNGVQDSTASTAINPNSGAGPGMTIGRRADAGSGFFDGRIGDLTVYDFAMNATDVYNLYRAGVDWMLPQRPLYGSVPIAVSNSMLKRMMEERLFIRGMAA